MRQSFKLRPINSLKTAILNNFYKIIEKMMITKVIRCISNDPIIINNNAWQNIEIGYIIIHSWRISLRIIVQ
jgi:hypothetical protein